MAEVPFNNADYAGINLPNMFGSPGDALKSGIAQKERQQARQDSLLERQMAEQVRQQQQDEMDLYRKTKMIQDLTDLSKHQTGSDVANAIGNEKIAEMRAKYTANVRNMSYSDLLSEITKDMSSTISSLDALKNELDIADKAVVQLRQQFPELDAPQVARDLRADALQRRIGKGNTFINPLEVAPSEMAAQLADPEFLSRYIRGNKSLVDEITNPKGMEEAKVFTGTPMENVRFEAKMPYWKQPTFKSEEVVGGFLPKGKSPSLKIKSEVIPAQALPSSGNRPFTVIDSEVYKRFSQDPNKNLELIQSTRQTFPNYDNFNREEKELAKRHVLYNTIEALDKSDFIPAASTRAPVSNTRINVSGGGDKNTGNQWVEDATNAVKSGDAESIKRVFGHLAAGNTDNKFEEVTYLTNQQTGGGGDVVQVTYDTGKVDEADQPILDFKRIRLDDPNFKDKLAGVYQLTMGSDVKVEKKPYYKENTAVKSTQNYTIKGKKYTKADLNKMGYSDEQIEQAIKLGTIKQ